MGGIQMLGKSDGEMLRGNAPHWAGLGGQADPGELARDDGPPRGRLLAQQRGPSPAARTASPSSGDGTVCLTVAKDNNVEGLKRLRKKLESMLSDLGLHDGTHHRNVYLYMGMDIAATAHQAGTARFGTDPDGSVLDVDCKAHDVDNLYVVDSSFFVSIGAVNPTLTIIANALRVGDHLVSRLG